MKRFQSYFVRGDPRISVVYEWKTHEVSALNAIYDSLDPTINHALRAERAVGLFFERGGKNVQFMNFRGAAPLEMRLPYDLRINGKACDVKTTNPGRSFYLSEGEQRFHRREKCLVVLCVAGSRGGQFGAVSTIKLKLQ